MQRKIVSSTKSDKLIIDLYNVVTCFLLTCALINDYSIEANSNNKLAIDNYFFEMEIDSLNDLLRFLKTFILIGLIFQLDDWRRSRGELDRAIQSATQAIEESKKTINGSSLHQEGRQAIINQCEAGTVNPFQVSFFYSKQKISWEIGQGQFLKLAQDLNEIFLELKDSITLDKPYPKVLSNKSMIFPYISPNKDTPTKVRVIGNYMGVLALLTLLPIKNYFELEANPNLLALWLAVQLIVLGISIPESYVRNRKELEKNLEGFARLYRDWFEWPPSCFGQQLTVRLVLFPCTRNFNKVLSYISSAIDGLQKAIQKNLVNDISDNLKEKIYQTLTKAFQHFPEEDSSVLESRFFMNVSQSSIDNSKTLKIE